MNKDININDKNSENYLINKRNLIESNSFSNEIKILTYDIHSAKNILKIDSFQQKKYKTDKNYRNEMLINKINLKDIFIPKCLFCMSKKRKICKLLLKESTKVIYEKLDIFNIFKNIITIEYINSFFENHSNEIIMPEEWVNNISNINKE